MCSVSGQSQKVLVYLVNFWGLHLGSFLILYVYISLGFLNHLFLFAKETNGHFLADIKGHCSSLAEECNQKLHHFLSPPVLGWLAPWCVTCFCHWLKRQNFSLVPKTSSRESDGVGQPLHSGDWGEESGQRLYVCSGWERNTDCQIAVLLQFLLPNSTTVLFSLCMYGGNWRWWPWLECDVRGINGGAKIRVNYERCWSLERMWLPEDFFFKPEFMKNWQPAPSFPATGDLQDWRQLFSNSLSLLFPTATSMWGMDRIRSGHHHTLQ